MSEGDPPQSKYAHFESFQPQTLEHVYMRHDEVGREIHQDALRRFTGNDQLTVELVARSTETADADDLKAMQQYDVVSSSSEISPQGFVYRIGPADRDNSKLYKQYFENNEMPIYVTAAGNHGMTGQNESPRIADFLRTSLVVGEGAYDKNGQPYVEEHSSTINPTIVADSPFNRGERYQMYDTAPSLEGHEELVLDFVMQKEFERRIDARMESMAQENAPSVSYDAVTNEVREQLAAENYVGSAAAQEKVAYYMDHPQALHVQMMDKIVKGSNGEIDAQGFTSTTDGTSFSTPELAGNISGAHYEQEQRAAAGKPSLTKEEISALAKMATIDVEYRESQAGLMQTYNNKSGFDFTDAGGHGMFQPDMFRALIDEAYVRLDNNPEIDRQAVTANMNTTLNYEVGSTDFSLGSDLAKGQDIVIERVRADFDFSVHGGGFPQHIMMTRADDENPRVHRFEVGAASNEFTGWTRQDFRFGESLERDQTLNISFPDGQSMMLRDLDVSVYGYNADGLMDQMMLYSQTIQSDYEVSKEAEFELKPASHDSMPLKH